MSLSQIRRAVAAAKTETGEKSAVAKALNAGGYRKQPLVQSHRNGRHIIRTYVWRDTPHGNVALVAGPSVSGQVFLVEPVRGDVDAEDVSIYIPGQGRRPAYVAFKRGRRNPAPREYKGQVAASVYNVRALPGKADMPWRTNPFDLAAAQESWEELVEQRRIGGAVEERDVSVSELDRGVPSTPRAPVFGVLYDSGGRKYRVVYRAIATKDNGTGPILASNTKNFAPSKGYPVVFQARSLGRPVERDKIDNTILKAFKPERLLLPHADPTFGAPVVWAGTGRHDTRKGVFYVLGGNSRVIALLRAPEDTYEEYAKEARALWPDVWPAKAAPEGHRYILVRQVYGKDCRTMADAKALSKACQLPFAKAQALAGATQQSMAGQEDPMGEALSLVRGLGVPEDRAALSAVFPRLDWRTVIDRSTVVEFQRKNAGVVDKLRTLMGPERFKGATGTPENAVKTYNSVLIGFLDRDIIQEGFGTDRQARAVLSALPMLVTLSVATEAGKLPAGWSVLPYLGEAKAFAEQMKNKSMSAIASEMDRALRQETIGNVTLLQRISPLGVFLGLMFKRAEGLRDPIVAVEDTLGPYVEAAFESSKQFDTPATQQRGLFAAGSGKPKMPKDLPVKTLGDSVIARMRPATADKWTALLPKLLKESASTPKAAPSAYDTSVRELLEEVEGFRARVASSAFDADTKRDLMRTIGPSESWDRLKGRTDTEALSALNAAEAKLEEAQSRFKGAQKAERRERVDRTVAAKPKPDRDHGLSGKALGDYKSVGPMVGRQTKDRHTPRQRLALVNSLLYDIHPDAKIAILRDIKQADPEGFAAMAALPVDWKMATAFNAVKDGGPGDPGGKAKPEPKPAEAATPAGSLTARAHALADKIEKLYAETEAATRFPGMRVTVTSKVIDADTLRKRIPVLSMADLEDFEEDYQRGVEALAELRAREAKRAPAAPATPKPATGSLTPLQQRMAAALGYKTNTRHRGRQGLSRRNPKLSDRGRTAVLRILTAQKGASPDEAASVIENLEPIALSYANVPAAKFVKDVLGALDTLLQIVREEQEKVDRMLEEAAGGVVDVVAEPEVEEEVEEEPVTGPPSDVLADVLKTISSRTSRTQPVKDLIANTDNTFDDVMRAYLDYFGTVADLYTDEVEDMRDHMPDAKERLKALSVISSEYRRRTPIRAHLENQVRDMIAEVPEEEPGPQVGKEVDGRALVNTALFVLAERLDKETPPRRDFVPGEMVLKGRQSQDYSILSKVEYDAPLPVTLAKVEITFKQATPRTFPGLMINVQGFPEPTTLSTGQVLTGGVWDSLYTAAAGATHAEVRDTAAEAAQALLARWPTLIERAVASLRVAPTPVSAVEVAPYRTEDRKTRAGSSFVVLIPEDRVPRDEWQKRKDSAKRAGSKRGWTKAWGGKAGGYPFDTRDEAEAWWYSYFGATPPGAATEAPEYELPPETATAPIPETAPAEDRTAALRRMLEEKKRAKAALAGQAPQAPQAPQASTAQQDAEKAIDAAVQEAQGTGRRIVPVGSATPSSPTTPPAKPTSTPTREDKLRAMLEARKRAKARANRGHR